MARAHRGFTRAGHNTRLTQWVGPALQGFQPVAGAGASIIASFTPGEALTIVRTRGFVCIKPNSVAADAEIIGAVGMGIVSSEALTAGIASMPEPFTDADWGGWALWRAFSYDFEFSDASGFNFPGWNFELDSKAMRKMGPNEALVVIAESQTGAYDMAFIHRVLVKLS